MFQYQTRDVRSCGLAFWILNLGPFYPGWTAKNPTLPVGSVSCVPQKRVTFGRPAAYLARASAGLGVPCPIRREKLRSEDVRIQKSGEYLNILNRSATTYGYGSKNQTQTTNAWGESTTIEMVVIPRSWPTKTRTPFSFPELLSRGPIYRSFPVVECPGILVQ